MVVFGVGLFRLEDVINANCIFRIIFFFMLRTIAR